MSITPPPPESERVRLAAGSLRSWEWVFEAWLAAGRDGEERPFYMVRNRTVAASNFRERRLEIDMPGHPLRSEFELSRDDDSSVLFGPVASRVEKVTVTPVGGAERVAELVGDEQTIGRYFVLAFDEAVLKAKVEVEPAAGWKHAPFPARNHLLEQRLIQREGTLVGEGLRSDGTRWQLRVWLAPYEGPGYRRVCLGTALDEQLIDSLPLEWRGAGAGYGGFGHYDEPLHLSMSGGGEVVGECAANVRAIHLRLDDGSTVPAEILETEILPENFWIAFHAPAKTPIGAVAFDGDGHVIAEHQTYQHRKRSE